MLDCIGESPINSLELTGNVDVDKAKTTINEISREVQMPGWDFNKETAYPLIRDSNGNIAYPPSALKCDTTDAYRLKGYDVVQRGEKLYNRKTRSFVFNADIEVDVTWLFTFEQLPEAVRRYIMIRAARVFQGRQQGSETQYKFTLAEEESALAAFKDAEGDAGDYNILSDSTSVAIILNR